MGERPETILTVGCPGSDIARQLDLTWQPATVNRRGSGCVIDASQPFLLVVFHPTTTEFGDERTQFEQLLEALVRLQQQTVLLWPNIDAGADNVSKAIRRFRDQVNPDWLRTLINLPPEEYLRVLANASCAVGNSSSFVRDASFYGTPVVLVGNRQNGRETDIHAVRVAAKTRDIEAALRSQLRQGRYAPSRLYGDGYVAPRIAERLVRLAPYLQKRLDYVRRDSATLSNGEAAHRQTSVPVPVPWTA
jgi:UDP-N-acetylglucosamine 2-epimerase